jgi:peptidyl-prolyl cis-trans isomerase C
MNRSFRQEGAMLALVLLLPTAMAACNSQKGAGTGNAAIQLADPGPAVETVNGEPVPQRLLDALGRSRNWDLSRPELRERALKELTNNVLAAQAARDSKLASDPDFAALLEVNRLQTIAVATAAQFQKQGQIDDAALKAEYDKQTAKTSGTEYDFSQIIFRDQATASKTAADIAGGKQPFEKAFEAHKADALQTRTFSHIHATQMPESLAKAIEAMKPGETTKTPVQTPLGWHVVHLQAATPHMPQPFEQVKESLRRSMLKRAGEERLMKLRAEAKITLTEPAPTPAAAASKVSADDANKPKN